MREQSQAFSADRPSATCPCQDPHKQLHAGVFFDGTDNNKDRDLNPKPPAKPKETNVVRLWQVYRTGDAANLSRVKLYVDGVGSMDTEKRKQQAVEEGQRNTRWYNLGLPKVWSRAKMVVDLGANIAGGAGGLGGKERLNRAYFWLKDQCAKLPPQGPKKVDVYGFSRGAALARTFVNLVRQSLQKQFPTLEVRFVGVFDTVGSFGIGGDDSNPGQCMYVDGTDARAIAHYTARHEYRHNFPLTPVAGNLDREYPGAHSDVGGGYPEGEDGRKNHLAWIACVDMYAASRRVEVQTGRPRVPGGVDVEGLRARARALAGQATKDRDNPRTAAQKQFFAEYIHESAKAWHPVNHPADDWVRNSFPERRRKLKGQPPDFDWE